MFNNPKVLEAVLFVEFRGLDGAGGITNVQLDIRKLRAVGRRQGFHSLSRCLDYAVTPAHGDL